MEEPTYTIGIEPPPPQPIFPTQPQYQAQPYMVQQQPPLYATPPAVGASVIDLTTFKTFNAEQLSSYLLHSLQFPVDDVARLRGEYLILMYMDGV